MINPFKKTRTVYIVYPNEDLTVIEAVCANKEALQKFLEKERLRYETLLKNKCQQVSIKSVDPTTSICNESYEISGDVVEPLYYDVEQKEVHGLNILSHKVWVVCWDCFESMYFSSEEAAKKWFSEAEFNDDNDAYIYEQELLW